MSTRAGTSIHYRRRWYYVLWVTLLLLSSAALVLWRRPSSIVQASLVVILRVRDAPPGTRVLAWCGPRAGWQGTEAGGPCMVQAGLRPDGSATLPLMRVQIARRRWVKDYIPQLTWDLVMIQFIPPDGPPRYFGLPISSDIRSGLLRPGWRLTNTISTPWKTLRTDAKAPDRLI